MKTNDYRLVKQMHVIFFFYWLNSRAFKVVTIILLLFQAVTSKFYWFLPEKENSILMKMSSSRLV